MFLGYYPPWAIIFDVGPCAFFSAGTVGLINGWPPLRLIYFPQTHNQIIDTSIIYLFQSMKPRTGVFCISINEARETTDLEMPDLRNTFVIKVSIVKCAYTYQFNYHHQDWQCHLWTRELPQYYQWVITCFVSAKFFPKLFNLTSSWSPSPVYTNSIWVLLFSLAFQLLSAVLVMCPAYLH